MTEKKVNQWVIPDQELIINPRLDPKVLLKRVGVDVSRPYTLQRDPFTGSTIVRQEVEDEV